MTHAAQEHLHTVTTARAEAEALNGSAGHLTEHITAAAGAVTVAFNTLIEQVSALAGQVEAAKTAVEATCIAAEHHTAATTATGHDTLHLVLAAQEHCTSADRSADAITDTAEGFAAAAEHAKTEAVAAVMGVMAQVDTFTAATAVIGAELGEAETNIRQVI